MRISALLSTIAVLSLSSAAQAETIYGISVPAATTNLVYFDSASPSAITSVGAVSGIVAGHTLRAIDFRPSDARLYAMSSNGASAQLYTINTNTGAATAVGGIITLTGNTSTRISMDFNPVANALRVVTGSGQSYRVNANNGTLIAQDTSILTPAGATPLISGVAYSNNVAGAATTTLYGYDFLTDLLGTIGGVNGVPSPNTGTFNAIGGSGIVTGDAGLGFDISGATGFGYMSVDDFLGSPGVNAELFRVNLATGVFTKISANDFASLLDISVSVPTPATLSLALLGLFAAGAVRRRATAVSD